VLLSFLSIVSVKTTRTKRWVGSLV
jgi:hypothetical protein